MQKIVSKKILLDIWNWKIYIVFLEAFLYIFFILNILHGLNIWYIKN
jgi:hypothetical protein